MEHFRGNKTLYVLLILVVHFNIFEFRRLIALEQQTEKNDIYHQLIDLKDFKFLINPQVCDSCQSDFFLISVIHNSITNYEQRFVIRQTWGMAKDCLKAVFMIGATNDMTVTNRIQEESEEYGDIVQGNFIDTYRNLTYKHVMSLTWASHYCTRAKYIVKTDDDVVVNIDLIYDMLKTDYWGSKGLMACPVADRHPVWRSTKESLKFAVTEEEYKGKYYPTYCSGFFTIYSADVAHKLVEESPKERYFWIEDVHVTGTLAKRINITHVDITDFGASKVLEKNLNKTLILYGPYDQSPKNMLELWKSFKEQEKDMRRVLKFRGEAGKTDPLRKNNKTMH